MWIARSKNEVLLALFNNKPWYNEEDDTWTDGMDSLLINPKAFGSLTFEESPLEVTLMSKEMKEEEFNKGVKFATDVALRMMGKE